MYGSNHVASPNGQAHKWQSCLNRLNYFHTVAYIHEHFLTTHTLSQPVSLIHWWIYSILPSLPHFFATTHAGKCPKRAAVASTCWYQLLLRIVQLVLDQRALVQTFENLNLFFHFSPRQWSSSHRVHLLLSSLLVAISHNGSQQPCHTTSVHSSTTNMEITVAIWFITIWRRIPHCWLASNHQTKCLQHPKVHVPLPTISNYARREKTFETLCQEGCISAVFQYFGYKSEEGLLHFWL